MSNLIKKLLKSKDSIEYITTLTNEELEEIITYSADKYYNTSNSVISDDLYDILIDYLKLKNPKSLILKKIGSKIKSKNKVILDYWLGSMDKIKPPSNQLSIWVKKYNPPYNISDKLDGISALIIYNLDKSIKMYTRGTASEGMDISHLIKYLKLPNSDTVISYCNKEKIKGNKNLLALRGELIMKEEIFIKNWSDQFKTGRNCVAGLVNSKTINPKLAQDIDLVLYEVIDPFNPINFISSLNLFNIVNNNNIKQELTFEYLSKILKERKNKSEYSIDGIIITSIGNFERNKSGNPDYAFAFKDILQEQIATTIIESIEWNISKDGLIKPTIILKPVIIGGIEIKRVTGNNAKFIVDNKLGTGAKVEIIRSGDVIPKIHSVLIATKAELPTSSWVWNETKVDIIINNINKNSDVLIKNIYYFFSTIKTKGLGEKNVEKIVLAGYNTVLKIITATKEDFLKIDGFAEKSATNLVKSIKLALKNISIELIMAASNKLGHGIGYEKIKQIISVYPNIINEYKSWTQNEFIDKIKEIHGWEEKTSSLFVSNFNNFIDFYNLIKQYCIIEKQDKKEGLLSGKIIVFTGFRDKDLETKIISLGGHIGATITKNTNYLVVKNDINEQTTKIEKANKLKIMVITKANFIKLLG